MHRLVSYTVQYLHHTINKLPQELHESVQGRNQQLYVPYSGPPHFHPCKTAAALADGDPWKDCDNFCICVGKVYAA